MIRAVEPRAVIDQRVPAGNDGCADTLARMFWRRVNLSRDQPAQLVKRSAAWRALSWGDVGDIVRQVALGLLALEEAMVYGDRRPYPVALVSVAPGPLAAASGLSAVRGAPRAIVRAGRRADPTQKLRRKVVAEKYDDLLQSLYRAA